MRLSLQNRVTPQAQLERSDARGMFMGNRGCLHNDRREIVRERTSLQAWVCCLLQYKGRKRMLMDPGKYTELFFLDEATALAAGHRPCATCRREDYNRFKASWALAYKQDPDIQRINKGIFSEMRGRLDGAPLIEAAVETLPDGAMFELPDGSPVLLHQAAAYQWTHHGYKAAEPISPSAKVRVLTPQHTLSVLSYGYTPAIHPSIEIVKVC